MQISANFTALCVIEAELLPMEFLHCGFRIFYFLPRDLDLDPMTFIYELDPYSMVMYRTVNTGSVYTGLTVA